MTKPWKEFRQEIVRLYIQEGRTLREVQEIMRRQHGFNASVRSYRQQFDHWGVGKYKCKRRPRRGDVSTVGVMPPPSPPATPTLPPITAPFTGAKPLMTVMSGDPGAMDYCWPTHRPSIHLENRETHPSRNPSVSQPLSSSPGVLVPCQPQSRAYQPHRTSLPIMSTHVDNAPSAWVQGRSAFAQSEATSRDGAELCSQRVPNPSVAMRDPLSSVYLDNKATLFGDVDWGVPRSAGYSLSDGDAAAYHGEQTIESRARPMQTYPSTSPCALVAAKGFVTASHLPLDRINIFGRDA